MPIKKAAAEIAEVAVVNSTIMAISMQDIEIALKILLLLITIIYTLDKLIYNRRNGKKNNK
jgi:hypothetical protein